MRKIDEIIVHCAAVPPDWRAGESVEAKRDEIRRWHVDDNEWSDIGYHAVIDRDGSIAHGRDFLQAGAHVTGHNANSLGVCLIGGATSSATDNFYDHFTPAQDKALRKWIEDRQREFPITRISGHNQYATKACPGFSVPEWLASETQHHPDPAEQPQSLWARFFSAFFRFRG